MVSDVADHLDLDLDLEETYHDTDLGWELEKWEDSLDLLHVGASDTLGAGHQVLGGDAILMSDWN